MTQTRSGTLRSNWFHVLAALAERDMHGSAIARDVLDQTDGSLKLWPATLYRTLDDMVAAGLITPLDGKAHPDGESERLRFYRITKYGRDALAAAVDRMATLTSTVRRRLRGVGS